MATTATSRPTAVTVWDVLRCPGCNHDGMVDRTNSVECPVCHREYAIDGGVIDLAPPGGRAVRSVTQRVMESRFYARFYEDVMRPRLTQVVTERSLPEEYRLAAEYLELGDATAVLDVACGTGNFTRAFAERIAPREDDVIVVGTDISWPMLEVARRKLREREMDDLIHLVRANATKSPFVTRAFDRIHCAGALHMMEDIDGALREFARLLAPDGILVIGTFVLGKGRRRRLLKRIAEIPTKFHWFAPGELEARLERAGFATVGFSVEGDALTVKAVPI